MRKFKFMSKAVVGMMAVAMTMGSFSGVAFRQPTAVYAEGAGDGEEGGGDAEVPAAPTIDYGTTPLSFTTNVEITDGVEPTLPSGYELAATPNVTVEPAFPQGITYVNGVIAGTPEKVAVPKEYTISFKIIKTTDNTDQSKAVEASGKVTLSVNGDETAIKLATPDMPTAAFTKGTPITPIAIPAATTGATNIKGYELSGFPDGLVVEEVKEGETVTGFQISGTPEAEAEAGTGYIVAKGVDNSQSIALAWIAVNVPAVQNPGSGNPNQGTETTLTPDYDTFTLDITGATDAKYAFLEVWKFGEKTATGFTNTEGSKDKLSNTYSYELTGGKVTVDLSFLKATTVQGIKVYTDKNTTKKELVIGAQPGKLSGLKYNSAEKKFDTSKAKEGKDPVSSTFDETLYEYRGQYAKDWQPLETLKDVNHTSAGSQIIVRKEATDKTPAGPEAKIKIAAAAKAPKISADYKKGTVKFSNKMMYGANGVAFVQAPNTAVTLTELRTAMNAPANQELVVFAYIKGDASRGKADSNVASIIIPAEKGATNTGTEVTIDGDTTSKVTLATDETGSGKSKKQVYKFTVTGEDFEISTVAPSEADRKWKKIDSKKAYTIELKDTEQTVYVRKAGIKGKAKDGSDSFFPSGEATVTVPAKSADKATKPAAGDNAGEVKVDGVVVLTIGRDTTTNTTINFTVTEGKKSVVDTLEYKIGSADYASIPSAPLTDKGTAEITVQVRVKKTDDKAASDPLDVVIAAVGGGENPAQKMATPTINVGDGKISVESVETATISRDTANGIIKIVAASSRDNVIQYSTDSGTNWTDVTGEVSVDGSTAITSVQIRTKASGSKGDSDALTVGVPKNLATSDVTVARKDTPIDGSTIVFTVDTGVTAALEYSITEGTWVAMPDGKEVASVATTGLVVNVRVKADDTAKSIASNPLRIQVTDK